MKPRRAIAIIGDSFPADSADPLVAALGLQFWTLARSTLGVSGECLDWRDDFPDVLVRYACLCLSENVERFLAAKAARLAPAMLGSFES